MVDCISLIIVSALIPTRLFNLSRKCARSKIHRDSPRCTLDWRPFVPRVYIFILRIGQISLGVALISDMLCITLE